jgi:hypothetical protein
MQTVVENFLTTGNPQDSFIDQKNFLTFLVSETIEKAAAIGADN